MSFTYPQAPANFDRSLLAPSQTFRKAARTTILTIILFVVAYLVLIGLAAGLVVSSIYLFYWLVSLFPNIITAILSGGLVIMSLLIFYFFIKFFFKVSKTDRSEMVEITAPDEPDLVNFIYQVADECRTQRPKRIYLTNGVNAMVFYDSSFLSLFLPVKKNLVIGTALINCINLSEFKAVLAHEFGHFSQESMRLGSYVYQVNKVLTNLVSEDDGYRILLDKWAAWGAIFAAFAQTTYSIVNYSRKGLAYLYEIINKSYLSLSRQMEFHADLVAASVSGANHIPSLLYRIEFGEWCYTDLLNNLDLLHKLNYKPSNLFELHRITMRQAAAWRDIPLRGNLPAANRTIYAYHPTTRINITNQWESHPSIKDREDQLINLPHSSFEEEIEAWVVFKSPSTTQELFTEKIYADINFLNTPEILSPESYEGWNKNDIEKYTPPSFYGKYYMYHDPQLPTTETPPTDQLETLFSDELTSKCIKLESCKSDIELAELILNHKINVSTFDFDGIKHPRYDIGKALTILRQEEQHLAAVINENDNKIAATFFSFAAKLGRDKELLDDYNRLTKIKELSISVIEWAQKLEAQLQPILFSTLTVEEINHILIEVYRSEKEFKSALNNLMTLEGFTPEILPEDHATLLNYYSAKTTYLVNNSYNNDGLRLCHQSLLITAEMVRKSIVASKNKLLVKQLELIGSN